MSERRNEPAAIRARTWIGAAVLFAIALLALDGFRRDALRRSEAARRTDERVPAALRDAAPDLGARPHEAPAVRPSDPARPAARRVVRDGVPRASRPASVAAPRREIDSRLAADLRILEDEAGRFARASDLGGDVQDDAASADARRASLADAFLIDLLVQDAYRGTEFPLGFPAEQRTYEAARSRVAGLDPLMRKSLLEAALAAPATERVETPRFEARFWEGVLP